MLATFFFNLIKVYLSNFIVTVINYVTDRNVFGDIYLELASEYMLLTLNQVLLARNKG